jgi:hypothetical protein
VLLRGNEDEEENSMSKQTLRTFWILALFACGVIVGCSGQTSLPPNPTVVSTTPARGAMNVPLAQAVSVTFNKAMNHSTITSTTFTLTSPGGIGVPGTVASAGTTSTFTPTLPLALGTVYTATVTTGVPDTLGNALLANFVWTFTSGTVPIVASTNPASSATVVPLNQKIAVTFNQTMNPATITAAGAFLLEITAGSVPVAGTVTYVAAANTALFTPTANLAPSTKFTATIAPTVQSASGNLIAGSYTWNFTTGIGTNTTPPTVVSTLLASAATLVPTDTILTATFSKAMDPTALTATGTVTLSVAGLGGAAVPATVNYAGNTVTLTGSSALAANKQYTATITTAAEDLTGNALAANDVWSFTTGAEPSTTAPTFTLTNPASASSTASLNGAVNATFSEAMNPGTVIAPGTFTLAVAGVGGAVVPGNVTYDVNSDIATFRPNANLTATTSYTATISNAATDVSGNPQAAGTIPNPWTFMTGSTTEQLPPNLGTAATFGAFGGGAGVTNQGIHTVINGDLGTTGASTLVTGFHDAGVGCTYTETGSDVGLVNENIDTRSAASEWSVPGGRNHHHLRHRHSGCVGCQHCVPGSQPRIAPRRHRSWRRPTREFHSGSGHLQSCRRHVPNHRRRSEAGRTGRHQRCQGVSDCQFAQRRRCGRTAQCTADQWRASQERVLASRQRRHD